MLTRLLVENFLLIREAELTFAPHLNVLTGETGTGKSILLDALGLVLGGRGNQDWIGRFGDALRIEAVFRVDRPVQRLVESLGIPTAGDELILAREMRTDQRGRCFINGRRVLQRVLRRIGSGLVEIHGQREEEKFRGGEAQRDLLDLYGEHGELRRRLREAHQEVLGVAAALAQHRAKIARLREEEDWIRFQLREIEEISPDPGEEAELREQLRALRGGAEITEWLGLAEELLNGRDGAVLEALETLDARTGALPADVEPWEGLREALRELRSGARDLYRRLRALQAESEILQADLPALEARLSEIERLRRKHRKPLEEILSGAEQMRADLAELEEGERSEGDLAEALAVQQKALTRVARELRTAREKAGMRLATTLQRELASLSMKDCRVRIALHPRTTAREGALALPDGMTVTNTGAEQVRFEAETNPGTGFRPLGEIASGGEMARIALAIRVVLGKRGRRMMTVFDEIDAGLGATAARAVAKRLQKVAEHRQVLLVTHLPVIAAAGAEHFRVFKARENGRTVARTVLLSAEERVGEIARMLSGDAKAAEARQHAEAILTEVGDRG